VTAVQKLLSACAAAALVFALTFSKENAAQAGYARVRAEEAASATPADIAAAFRDLAYSQRRPSDAVSEYVAPHAISHTAGGDSGVLEWIQRRLPPDGGAVQTVSQGDLVVELRHSATEASAGIVSATVYRVVEHKIVEIWEIGGASS
jgi:predicted SnoaL-like aldol condensation-catalyzing enzyme